MSYRWITAYRQVYAPYNSHNTISSLVTAIPVVRGLQNTPPEMLLSHHPLHRYSSSLCYHRFYQGAQFKNWLTLHSKSEYPIHNRLCFIYLWEDLWIDHLQFNSIIWKLSINMKSMSSFSVFFLLSDISWKACFLALFLNILQNFFFTTFSVASSICKPNIKI